MAAAAGAAYHFSAGRGYDQDDDDRPQQNAAGTFKVPDKDFYRCALIYCIIIDTNKSINICFCYANNTGKTSVHSAPSARFSKIDS